MISFTHEVCNLLANVFSDSEVLQLAHGIIVLWDVGLSGKVVEKIAFVAVYRNSTSEVVVLNVGFERFKHGR